MISYLMNSKFHTVGDIITKNIVVTNTGILPW